LRFSTVIQISDDASLAAVAKVKGDVPHINLLGRSAHDEFHIEIELGRA
jgi:hypothetical protein